MKKILILVVILLLTFTLSGCKKETKLPSVGTEYTHCYYIEENSWMGVDKVICTDNLGIEVEMYYSSYKRYYDIYIEENGGE